MEKRTVGIARTFLLFIILLQGIHIVGSSAFDADIQRKIIPNSSHEVVIDALTWKAYSRDCIEGSILSGSFEVSCEGSLYPGDEQKYDDWAPESIHFYIFNETEYSKFIDRESFTPSFVREDTSHLTWEFEIPSTGRWHIAYYNTAIYLMIVSGTVTQSGEIDATLLATLILSSSLIAIGVFYYLKKRE